jgi:dinuclear metal center YbgI/SA1388 family protein
MHTVESVSEFLEAHSPNSLAEDWDNVGLLVGDKVQTVERLMTCLTVTPESAAEAVAERVDLIVTHHPLPFRPLKRLTTASHEGRLLWDLMRAGVSIYSPHTAHDSSRDGVNQQLAQGIGLGGIKPLIPAGETPSHTVEGNSGESEPGEGTGGGRYGKFEGSPDIAGLVERVKAFLGIDHVQLVTGGTGSPSRVAVACGSAGEFLRPAIDAGCHALVTGEVSFHTCLEAKAAGVSLILTGHYASERFAVELLADVIGNAFPELSAWASREETNPLEWS